MLEQATLVRSDAAAHGNAEAARLAVLRLLQQRPGNFRRSGNKLAYAYMLTPTGLREKLRLTRAFLQRKEAEFEQLQHTIAALKSELVEVDKAGG